MTEPGPDATFAEQVAHLRGELSRYAGQLGQLRGRLDERSGQESLIRLDIKKLGEKIDAALTQRQMEDPPAPFWRGLSKDEFAAELAQLQDWVERFARVEYSAYLAKIPPCWPAHREALWELSNLMTEWVRIYGDPEYRPLQDALWFHERWLPGGVARVGSALAKCDLTGCALARSSPYERSPPRYP
ncbi:MAG: hypothetical protein ACRDOU_05350 [Streptosporangiaceae bacterium]